MTLKSLKLQSDYSDKKGYGISAYSAEGGRGARKEAFLKDGKALLRRVAREFESVGWKSRVIKNRGGIAVSGEVYAYLNKAGMEQSLFVEISGTSMSIGRKADGALIMVQVRSNDGRNSILGHNIYLDANLDSEELAFELWAIARKLS